MTEVAYAKVLLFESQSPQWWEDFMEEAFVAPRDKRSVYVSEGMQNFCELLTRKVVEAVSKVRSSILRGEVPLPNPDASSRSD